MSKCKIIFDNKSSKKLFFIKYYLIFAQLVFEYICLMKLYEKIAQIREAKRISRAEIATALNMSSQSYWNIETGKTEITVSRLGQIAQILGVSVVELLTNEAQKVEDSEEVEKLKKRIEELEYDKEFLQDSLKIKENGINRYRKIILDMLDQNRSLYDIMLKVEPTESNGVTPETMKQIERWLKIQGALSEMLDEIFNKK